MPPRRRVKRQATGDTSRRGYGRDHQARRAQLLAHHVDGTPCDYCREPMYLSQDLEADHTDPRALNPNSVADRLLHSSCNRKLGQVAKAELAAQRGDAAVADQPLTSLAALASNRAERQQRCARDW